VRYQLSLISLAVSLYACIHALSLLVIKELINNTKAVEGSNVVDVVTRPHPSTPTIINIDYIYYYTQVPNNRFIVLTHNLAISLKILHEFSSVLLTDCKSNKSTRLHNLLCGSNQPTLWGC